MRICQKLYEGGFITYMRTDSHKYSNEFVISAREHIIKQYDLRYVSDLIDTLVSQTDGDDAHEAIRPTSISLSQLPDTMESKDKRMYKLIWENTLESCMAAATFHSITSTITAAQRLEFNYTTMLVDFSGWKIVSKKHENEISPVNKEYQYLQSLQQNHLVLCKKVTSTVTLTNTKSHYSEAMLVNLLEAKGIGRPSTFASLVDKLIEREYVKKEDIQGTTIICKDLELQNNEVYEIETKREFGNEKNKLKIQPLGMLVMEFLLKHFNKVFEYDFTKEMELFLDNLLINDNKKWHEICKDCNDTLITLISNVSVDKMSIKIDEDNTYIIGKFGPVIKCVEKQDNGNEKVSFKSVNKETDVQQIISGQVSLKEVTKETKRESTFILGRHNEEDVFLKKGKFGLYITWGKNSKTLKELGNRPMECVTYSDVEKYLLEGSNVIRDISNSISIRKGAKGHYVFYKTQKMKSPTFFSLNNFKNDYEKCDVHVIKLWLKDNYSIA
jgi:DNA topoisomerase-1